MTYLYSYLAMGVIFALMSVTRIKKKKDTFDKAEYRIIAHEILNNRKTAYFFFVSCIFIYPYVLYETFLARKKQ